MKYSVELSELDQMVELSKEIGRLEFRLTQLKLGSINYIKTKFELDDKNYTYQQIRGNIMMPSRFIG